VVFLTCMVLTRQHAACASESDSITLAGPVSPQTLNAACLLCVHNNTDSPALNSGPALGMFGLFGRTGPPILGGRLFGR